MKTANKKKTLPKTQKGTVAKPKSKRSDADEYGILPGDNWVIKFHKIVQSVGGIEFPPHK